MGDGLYYRDEAGSRWVREDGKRVITDQDMLSGSPPRERGATAERSIDLTALSLLRVTDSVMLIRRGAGWDCLAVGTGVGHTESSDPDPAEAMNRALRELIGRYQEWSSPPPEGIGE